MLPHFPLVHFSLPHFQRPQPKDLTFSFVYAVFGRLLPGFRSVADPRSSTRLQIAFSSLGKASKSFPEILRLSTQVKLLRIQNQVSTMSRISI